MLDITAISSILSSVKNATDIAKMLKEIDLSFDKAEAKLKLAELIEALADTKMQVAEVRELLLQKDEEIQSLQKELKVKGSLYYEKPYYWIHDKENKDGPFCQACYDNSLKLVRLQSDEPGYWKCKLCRNSFTDSSFNPKQYGGEWDAFT